MRKLSLPLIAAMAAAFGASAAMAETITVATAGPITGQYASFGEQMQRGRERFADQVVPELQHMFDAVLAEYAI